MDALTSLGYEPEFGARPLMQREILNDLSKRILSGNIIWCEHPHQSLGSSQVTAMFSSLWL